LIKKAYKECKALNIYCKVFEQAKGQQIFVVQYLCEDTLSLCHSECSWIYHWQPGALQQLQSTNRFKYVVLNLLYIICITVPKNTWVAMGLLWQHQPSELQVVGVGKYIVAWIISETINTSYFKIPFTSKCTLLLNT
jgi:hypothetical protein